MAEGFVTRRGGGGIDVSDATATENDVLQGETFYSGDTNIKTGNIPSKGAETFTPGTTNQTISSGQYLSGTQTILGDSDLQAGNIKDGVTIFGVTGTLVPAPLFYTLTIDSTKVDSTLTDFPVMVKTTSADYDMSLLTDDNVYFTLTNGTLLDFEVEYATTSERIYHVKIPTISSSVNTEFNLRFNGSGYTNGRNATSVWSNNYEMVQHMGNSLVDSTGNAHNGTSTGTTVVSGLNGNGRNFDGVDDYIRLGTTVGNFGNGDFSILTVGNGTSSNEQVILSKTNGGSPSSTYGFLIASNGAFATASGGTSWGDSGTYGRYATNPRPNEVSGFKSFYASANRSNSNPTFFVNDIQNSTSTWLTGSQFNTVGNISNTLQTTIGAESDVQFFYQGIIDEIRISNIARNNAWIKAEYYSLFNTLISSVVLA